MTTIHSLPPEIISKILEEFDGDPYSLFTSSLVHPSWTSPSLALLYRTVRISNKLQAGKLADTSIRHYFQKTRKMTLWSVEWSAEVEMVLRACGGLRSLAIYRNVLGVPENVLEYPSFQSYVSLSRVLVLYADLQCDTDLQDLTLYSASFVEQSPTSIHLPLPARLQSLSTCLSTEILPLLQKLSTACLSNPTPTLTSLSVTNGQEHLPSLISLAPNLTSFYTGYFQPSITKSVTTFLTQSSNLSYLALEDVGSKLSWIGRKQVTVV